MDLRFIFEKAHEHQGYAGTTEAKRWASIATGMGLDCRTITNAGWLVRTHYLRFLMPVEKAMKEEGVYDSVVPLPPMSEEAKKQEEVEVALEALEAAEAAAEAAAAAAQAEREDEEGGEEGEPAAAAAAGGAGSDGGGGNDNNSNRGGRSRSQQTRTPSVDPSARRDD